MLLFFRLKNDTKQYEECSYYNQNYTIFAENGYNWSLGHLDNRNINTIPCQTYHYSVRQSVVPEVGIY